MKKYRIVAILIIIHDGFMESGGLLKKRIWRLILTVINCMITLALMIFMLPAGIMDSILACTALILILTQYFGKTEITT